MNLGRLPNDKQCFRYDDGTPKAVTLVVRHGKEGGGKGALWQIDVCSTMSATGMPYLFAPKTKRRKGRGE